MARRSWTIIPGDWIQLERVINQLGYNILDVPSSLSDIISDISTAKSDLVVKINSDEILLSDATVIASHAAADGISDAVVVQSHLTYRANSIENLASDAIAKCDSDEVVLSDRIFSVDAMSKSDDAVCASHWRVALNSDEIILSDQTTLISNKLYSDIVAEISNRATGDSNLRVALNSDEVVLSDNIVVVSNAVGAGGGATQSEMDAVSDRLVSVSNELDVVSDSLLSIETYLSNDTAAAKSDLILKINSDEVCLSDRAVVTSDALISPTFVDMQITEHAYFDAEVDNGNSGAADTINWTIGNKQKSTLTADCVYTFTSPSGPCNLIFKIVQDAVGGRTVTWPATVKWPLSTAPTLSIIANAVDVIAFYYDGTNYYGSAQLNFGAGETAEQRDYLLYRDVKVAGTNGGTFTSGAWRVRTLTEETIDTGGNGALAANQITLVAGVYECIIKCPAHKVNAHQCRLYNVTDATIVVYGSSEYSSTTVLNSSIIIYRFTTTTAKVFQIEHRCGSTNSTYGFGRANNFGGDEIYTIAQFCRVH